MPIVTTFDMVPQSNLWFSVLSLLGLLLPVLLVAALLFALYWVIRLAVAAGARDRRRECAHDDVESDVRSLP